MVQANALNEVSTGFQSFNGTATFAGRTLQAGTGISIANGNGVSGDPTISATGGGTPNSVVTLADDFIGVSGAGTDVDSVYWWTGGTVSFDSANATSNAHPGILANANAAAGNECTIIMLNNAFILGGGALTVNFVFNIATASDSTNRYTLRVGLGSTIGADQVNGCYFEYSDNVNSGQWALKTAAASVRTTTNTVTAVTTGWHNAQVTVNAGATSVNFTMDGVSLGDITTNIPTASCTPILDCDVTAGTMAGSSVFIDLFYLTQTLTSAR